VSARRRAYEQAVLRVAVDETPGRVRPVAKRLAQSFAQQSLEQRHACAVKGRRVIVHDLEDGMSELVATLPSPEAHAIYQRLTAVSRVLQRSQHTAAAKPDTAPTNATAPTDTTSTNAAFTAAATTGATTSATTDTAPTDTASTNATFAAATTGA